MRRNELTVGMEVAVSLLSRHKSSNCEKCVVATTAPVDRYGRPDPKGRYVALTVPGRDVYITSYRLCGDIRSTWTDYQTREADANARATVARDFEDQNQQVANHLADQFNTGSANSCVTIKPATGWDQSRGGYYHLTHIEFHKTCEPDEAERILAAFKAAGLLV